MLNQLFTSEVRVKILTFLLLGPKDGMYVRELVRLVGTEINAVRRELGRLVGINLLKEAPAGNRLYYKVNAEHYLYPELLALVTKEKGLAKDLHDKRKLLGEVEFMMIAQEFVLGRVAKEGEIDLLIIGKPQMKLLEDVVNKAEKELGRNLNYTVLTKDDYEVLLSRNDKFLLKALIQPRIILLGEESKWCRVE